MGELSEPGSREIDGQARGRVSGRRSSQLISDFELPIADRGGGSYRSKSGQI
jgi:hypothetical protein